MRSPGIGKCCRAARVSKRLLLHGNQILRRKAAIAKLASDELLSAVDVISCAREGSVGHNVYGERRHVRRSDHASDGKRGAKLGAAFFNLIAQQFRG